MKTVVLCIDRDNDVGEKAGIKGPIIGRKDNLAAAMKLALADPEDTDLNTIFAAVRLFDQMKLDGREVEVVTVLGDRALGLVSDEKISHQIDVIVQVLKADSAVIVTDGAEDEHILPVIQSRLKILHIERVIVKSLPTGKETVSILRRYMQEERFRIQLLLPISLAMLTYVVFFAFEVAQYYFPALLAFIGGYLALTALNVGDAARNLSRAVRVGVATSRLSMGGAVLALAILLLGAVVAMQYIITGNSPFLPQTSPPTDVGAMLVLFGLLYAPVMYLALLTRLSFRLLDFRLRRGRNSGGLALRYIGYTSYFCIGWGVAHGVAAFIGLGHGWGAIGALALILLGVVVMLGGAFAGRRFKERLVSELEEAGA